MNLAEDDRKLQDLARRYKENPTNKEALYRLLRHLQRIGELRSGDIGKLYVTEVADALRRTGIWGLQEDIAKLAAHTAALLMRVNGDSDIAATRKTVELLGQTPDDELLHQATKDFGVGKKGRQKPLQHWIRQGAHNPDVGGVSVKEEKIESTSTSAMADVGVSYYTLDEAIVRLLCGATTARKILEKGKANVRSTQR